MGEAASQPGDGEREEGGGGTQITVRRAPSSQGGRQERMDHKYQGTYGAWGGGFLGGRAGV